MKHLWKIVVSSVVVLGPIIAFALYSNAGSLDNPPPSPFIELSNITTDATETELFTADGSSISVPVDSTIGFTISIVARRTDVDGEGAFYRLQGGIHNNAGTTTIPQPITKKIFMETEGLWDVSVEANDTDDTIRVLVKGQVGKTVEWKAKVFIVEEIG